MQFGYSKKTNIFYFLDEEATYRESGFWQDDIKSVTDEVWHEFVGEPPAGKRRGSDDQGFPCWIDLPPLSEAECLENRMLLKKGMLHEALEELHKLEVIAGITQLSSSDNDKLHSWKSYVKQLYETKIDDSNVAWPDRPEAF